MASFTAGAGIRALIYNSTHSILWTLNTTIWPDFNAGLVKGVELGMD